MRKLKSDKKHFKRLENMRRKSNAGFLNEKSCAAIRIGFYKLGRGEPMTVKSGSIQSRSSADEVRSVSQV